LFESISCRSSILRLMGLALCVFGTAQAQPASTLSWEPFSLKPRGQPEVAAERAQLNVPLRHAQPTGASITLNIVRLPALQPGADAAPVVYLAGGPGGSGVSAALGARWPIFAAVRRDRDVILLDQRGTGASSPPPACPHKVEIVPSRGYGHAESLRAFQDNAARCMAFWREKGLDPNAFNTAESAADLAALQRALNARALSLWGMSYGTHLALAALKQPGLTVDRLLLMGTEGPDQTIKLPLDADALLAQIGIANRKPDLAADLRKWVDKLNREPIRLTESQPMVITGFDLQLLTAAMLGRRQTSNMLPLLLRELEGGRSEALAQALLRLTQAAQPPGLMPLAMDIASGASPARLAKVREQESQSVLGAALNFPFPQIGDGLGVGDLGEAFRADPKTDRPTQFVSGEFDGRTPPSNVTAIERGFSQRGHWLVEGAGHDDELWLTSSKLAELIVLFFNGAAPSDQRLSATSR
jgi:pimeloyl-ACP methyl ester carboxylesterase